MPRDDQKTILFAAVVCVVCSLILSATAAVLKDRQNRNADMNRKRNVLQAFGVQVTSEKGDRIVSDEEVDGYFSANISEVILNGETGDIIPDLTSNDLSRKEKKLKTRLPLYLWTENGAVTKYAFPISGRGLWSTIHGYLALQKDLATVIGATFYKHGETPGLGGECSEPWFLENFQGIELWEAGKLLPFQVVKNGVDSRYPEGCNHCVDGIAAATITSNGIQKFVREDMAKYNKYFDSIRGS